MLLVLVLLVLVVLVLVVLVLVVLVLLVLVLLVLVLLVLVLVLVLGGCWCVVHNLSALTPCVCRGRRILAAGYWLLATGCCWVLLSYSLTCSPCAAGSARKQQPDIFFETHSKQQNTT